MMQLTIKNTLSALALTTGLLATSQASAAIYHYEITNPPGSDAAGDVTFFSATFNDVTEQLTWTSTVQTANGNLADGFWLVLSDGENPKNNVDEYSIFYGDSNSGNLTSYVYSGANNANSWNNPGIFIESFAGGLTTDTSVANEVTFSFSIDTSNINSFYNTADWDGASFGEYIGAWYHPAIFGGNGPTYDPQTGEITSLSIARAGWYDTAWQPTTEVPVPAAAWLFLSGLIGLVGVSRRRA